MAVSGPAGKPSAGGRAEVGVEGPEVSAPGRGVSEGHSTLLM